MGKPTRVDLDPQFSEGARLLWLAIQRAGLSAAKAAEEVGVDGSTLHRWLYGSRRPGRAHGVALAERFEIPAEAWDAPPSETFAPPGAAEDDAADAAPLDGAVHWLLTGEGTPPDAASINALLARARALHGPDVIEDTQPAPVLP